MHPRLETVPKQRKWFNLVLPSVNPYFLNHRTFLGGVGRWHEKLFVLDTQGNEKTQNENRRQEEEWKVRTVATLSRFKGQKWQRSLTHPDSTQERTKGGDESFIDQMAQSQNVQSSFPQIFPWTSGFNRSEPVTGTSHSKTLSLNDLHRQMQRLHPWAESKDGSHGHPKCPSDITLILLHLQQGGRERGKGAGKEGKSRRRMPREWGTGSVKGTR